MATIQEKKNAPLPTRLRKLVAEGEWTQKEVADNVGVKPQSISQYLDGTVNPSYAVLIGIADLFHVSTDYLLGRTEIATDDINTAHLAEKAGLSAEAIRLLQDQKKVRLMIERILNSDDVVMLARALGDYNSFSYGKRINQEKMEYSEDEEDEEYAAFFREEMLQMMDRETEFAQQAFELIKKIFMSHADEMPYTEEIPVRKNLFEELLKLIPHDQRSPSLQRFVEKIQKEGYDAQTF